jgi:hypothetical protein
MGTCAKYSKRRQSLLLCRYCVRPVECRFLSITTTYAAIDDELIVLSTERQWH